MDRSPPGSSVYGILQARIILEWVAMPSSRGSSWPRDPICASYCWWIAGGFFTAEPPGKPICRIHVWSAGLDESQVGIKIAGRYADDSTLIAESEEELKSFLMRVKEENEKAGLKLNIQKTKIMAYGPITSWQIEGGKWNQWQIFFSWAPKSLWTMTAAMKIKDACFLEGKLWQT